MIYSSMRNTITKITDMKFELPRQADEAFRKAYGVIGEEIHSGLRNLAESA